MKLTVSPAAAREATYPAVGIFWRIGSALLIDRSPLATAEPYGDCLTHAAGHYERWESWRALGTRGLLSVGYPPEIAFSEYDAWPRGRTIYETERDCFVLYRQGSVPDSDTDYTALRRDVHQTVEQT